MKIIIAAGTGFLGKNLEEYFTGKGNQVSILTRNPKRRNEIFWDAKTLGEWKNLLENTDVLINLTGKSVDCRYTDKNKQEIYSSRINSTKILQRAVDECTHKPKIWLNSGSATIYVHSEKHLNTEENGIIGDDFSMNICKSWQLEIASVWLRTETELLLKSRNVYPGILMQNGFEFAYPSVETALGNLCRSK